jgi:hypothetical protein
MRNIALSDRDSKIGRLMTLFAVIYIAEGMGQVGGLIGQPLNFYLLKTFDWDATKIAAMVNVLAFPWFIRPVYGIISDFVPIFGYRRKLYLVLANMFAVIGYLLLTQMTSPAQIGFALVLTALGLAVSSTLCGAVLVENGKRSGLNSKFVTQQWLWFYIANVCAMIIGGQLCKSFAPETALHLAAGVIAVTIVGAVVGCWFLIDEQKTTVDLQAMKRGFKSLGGAMTSRTLWIVGSFIFCFYFSPGLGTPLYVHMTKTLHFGQDFIGILGAITAVGCIAGSLLFKYLSRRFPMKNLVYITIMLGAVAQGTYVLLGTQESAVILNLVNGACNMMAVLSIFTLAADHCPDGSEGFTYALLNSIHNATTPISNQVGSYLYDHTFNHNLIPLVMVSATVTAMSLILIPLLKLGTKVGAQEQDPDFSGAGQLEPALGIAAQVDPVAIAPNSNAVSL